MKPELGTKTMETETWHDAPTSEILAHTLARERTYMVPSNPADPFGPPPERTSEPGKTTEVAQPQQKAMDKPMDKTATPPTPAPQSAVGLQRSTNLRGYWAKMTPEQKSAEMLKRMAARKAKRPSVNPTLAEQATAKLQRQYDAESTPKRAHRPPKGRDEMMTRKPKEAPANPFNPLEAGSS